MNPWHMQAQNLRDRLISWRRDFHRHPELSFHEERTAASVAQHLAALGYEVRTGVAKTGVVGLLRGSAPGPAVLFRFDMDALKIVEESGADYASQVAGAMHACGHDGHVAMGMGLAELFAGQREALRGTLKLVFQPAEEGGNGAERMVQEGVLDNPRTDVAICSHLWLRKPVGTVDVTAGPVMAASDKWTAVIRGRGGHGAMPEQTVDPIVAAAQVITALQSVVSRNVSALETAVVTVGSIHGGEVFNVIPPEVKLVGTLRTFAPQTRETVVRRAREVVEGVAAACGASAEWQVKPLTPPVINDPAVTQAVREAAASVLGAPQVTSGERTMGSEDAALFLSQVPGCYFFIGGRNEVRGLVAPHHNPHFDFDEEALVIGLAVLAEVAARYLLA